MYTLGMDIGSTTSKAVILRDGREIVASSMVIATVGTLGVFHIFQKMKKRVQKSL